MLYCKSCNYQFNKGSHLESGSSCPSGNGGDLVEIHDSFIDPLLSFREKNYALADCETGSKSDPHIRLIFPNYLPSDLLKTLPVGFSKNLDPENRVIIEKKLLSKEGENIDEEISDSAKAVTQWVDQLEDLAFYEASIWLREEFGNSVNDALDLVKEIKKDGSIEASYVGIHNGSHYVQVHFFVKQPKAEALREKIFELVRDYGAELSGGFNML